MAVPAELQCSPHALQFSAHVGQDAPLRFTLFNPHPTQRIAFKIKTTASSTYRVWPNCGPLEPGETQRVQILLLGTKVDLARPELVEECNYDRFQVQYVPLPEGMSYDGGLYKQMPALVRDIKLNVSVVVLPPSQSVSTSGTAPGEPLSPWEGMVRVSLLRMLADEDRDATHNAACLTKFMELLLLNGIISTQQMWTVFNLVADLFEGAGASGEQLLNKVEQWLDTAEAPTDAGPPVSEPLSPTAKTTTRRRPAAGTAAALGAPLAVAAGRGDRRGGTRGLDSPETPDRPEPRSGASPRPLASGGAAARDGDDAAADGLADEPNGQESYPASLASRAATDESVVDDGTDEEGGNEDSPVGVAPVAAPRAAITAVADLKSTTPASADVASRRLDDDGFGSAHSSVVEAESPSQSPEAADEDLRRSHSLPASPSAPGGASASEVDSLEAQLAAVRAQAKAMASVRANSSQLNGSDGALPSPTAEVGLLRTKSAPKNGYVTARTLDMTPTKDPGMLTLEERIARLEKQTNVVSLHADSAAIADIPDEAFAPEMLEEARRSAVKRSTEVTGPHMLSFAERAAMYDRVVPSPGGSLPELERRGGSSQGSRIDSDGSAARRLPKGNGDAAPRPVRRSLLADDSLAVRNSAVADDAAAPASPRASPTKADEDPTVPSSPSIGDGFVTAGPRVKKGVGRRPSARGLDVLASVNPDGAPRYTLTLAVTPPSPSRYPLPKRAAAVGQAPSHIPGMAAFARHLSANDGRASEEAQATHEAVDYRNWSRENAGPEDDRDGVDDSVPDGGDETPTSYRQVPGGGLPVSPKVAFAQPPPRRDRVARWRGDPDGPALRSVSMGPTAQNRLTTKSLQSQPEVLPGPERSRNSYGTVQTNEADGQEVEDGEMRFGTSSGGRASTRAALDLTEPVRQGSSLMNHLATADPTLPSTNRAAAAAAPRASVDDLAVGPSFQPAVGIRPTSPWAIRQTKSMAPGPPAPRIAELVGGGGVFGRASQRLDVALEQRNDDSQPGSPVTRETSQTSSQPGTPSGAPAAPPQRKKKGGMFKRIGNALTARAQQAATQAGQSGYYYV